MITKLIILTAFALFAHAEWMHSSTLHRHPRQTAKRADYEPPDFWAKDAQETLLRKLAQRQIENRAKNVILFLGDGWGVTSLTAGRILKGQKVDGLPFGEEGVLHVDTFPFSGTSKTYCVDAQVADSACSATAYLCGVKANIGTVGVTSDVQRRDCEGQRNVENHVSSILQWAQKAGMSTGIVSTTQITEASPAGTFAHIANRDWESDADVIGEGLDPELCDDVAEQLILSEPGRNIDVILGGGRRKFLPKDIEDGEGYLGERQDGKNLIEQWKTQNANINASYVETIQELSVIDASVTDRLMGLFSPGHLAWYHNQQANNDPTLADMTEKAIQILSKNPNGFFLFVEGGQIDNGHHGNQAQRALWEAIEFDRAIKMGDEMTSDQETLIVVTADHSHVMTFAGYPERGNNLMGMAGMGDDGLPYSTLGYPNGPGFVQFVNNTRHNLTGDDVDDLDYRQVPLVPLGGETHGGEDVMIFSKGPFAHLLTGVQQQNYIPHVMAYASCVGSGKTYCNQ